MEDQRGRPVPDDEVSRVVDQMYALADLILEAWLDRPD